MARTYAQTHLSCAWPVLFTLINAWSALAATRCYDNLGCFESLTLHALPQEPAHLRTEFRVSCRGHIDDAILRATDSETVTKDKIEQSCLTVGKPIRMISHGFRDSGTATWVGRLRDALLTKEDCNVVAVDWHHGSPFPYDQAVANSFLVAKQVANLIRHLELVHGVPPLAVHLIGHSIGSHISGLAGADVAPSRVGRVTGLDPAEPQFDTFDNSLRLDKGDAIFVDVIHTDGERFAGYKGYGSMRSQGHVDFFPNGGLHQPGCGTTGLGSALAQGFSQASSEGIGCSHSRAIDLFIRSVETDISSTSTSTATTNSSDDGCSLWGNPQCPSWEVFEDGNCTSCPDAGSGCLPLGFHADSVPGVSGDVYLSTSAEYPFCGLDYMITVQVSSGQKRAYGRLVLTLKSDTSGSEFTIDFSRSNRHYHSLDTDRHVVTTNAKSVTLDDVTVLYAEFFQGPGISALGTADVLSLARVDVESTQTQTRASGEGDRWSYCSSRQEGPWQNSKGSNQILRTCGTS